jgi:molybdopterin synthase catalytic subunit
MATRVEFLNDVCSIVTEPIDLGSLTEKVRTDTSGAVALFAGVVRDHHKGTRVDRLEYEAYAPMAEREMRRIISDLHDHWDLQGVAIVHRIGRLEVGETSVAIVISAAHRKEALDACAVAIDRVKGDVPVWKKEHGAAGGDWVIGDDSPRARAPLGLPVSNRSARRPPQA